MEPEGSLPHSQAPPPVPILIQINPVHAFPYHFLSIQFNIIFPPTPTAIFPSDLPTSVLYALVLCPIHVMFLAHINELRLSTTR